MRKIKIILPICFCIFIIFSSHDASAEVAIHNPYVEGIFGSLSWHPDALNSDSEVRGNYEVIITAESDNSLNRPGNSHTVQSLQL